MADGRADGEGSARLPVEGGAGGGGQLSRPDVGAQVVENRDVILSQRQRGWGSVYGGVEDR